MPASHPSIAHCLSLMDEHAMLSNIRRHSFAVARVAERVHSRLARTVKTDDLPPRQLVIAGALLHDIAKTPCLQNHCDHAEVGARICEQHGLFEVAEIVGEHVRLRRYDLQRYQRGSFLAKELIFYADKRIVHDAIVSLDERLEYILARYGRGDPDTLARIRMNFDNCRNLESSLCAVAGQNPDELLEKIALTPYDTVAP